MNLKSRNFYKEFIEDEKQFYLREAGFDEREEELFRLRVYKGKTLWEASEIMGYSSRTMDRINRTMKKKIIKSVSAYSQNISSER